MYLYITVCLCASIYMYSCMDLNSYKDRWMFSKPWYQHRQPICIYIKVLIDISQSINCQTVFFVVSSALGDGDGLHYNWTNLDQGQGIRFHLRLLDLCVRFFGVLLLQCGCGCFLCGVSLVFGRPDLFLLKFSGWAQAVGSLAKFCGICFFWSQWWRFVDRPS